MLPIIAILRGWRRRRPAGILRREWRAGANREHGCQKPSHRPNLRAMHIRILPHPARTAARGLPNTNASFFRQLPIPRPAAQWPKTTSMAGFEQHAEYPPAHVAQHAQEFGISAAVGATPWSTQGTILRECAVPVSVGVSVGLAISLDASRAICGMLSGVRPAGREYVPLNPKLALVIILGRAEW
jgi:hypothetical protein